MKDKSIGFHHLSNINVNFSASFGCIQFRWTVFRSFYALPFKWSAYTLSNENIKWRRVHKLKVRIYLNYDSVAYIAFDSISVLNVSILWICSESRTNVKLVCFGLNKFLVWWNVWDYTVTQYTHTPTPTQRKIRTSFSSILFSHLIRYWISLLFFFSPWKPSFDAKIRRLFFVQCLRYVLYLYFDFLYIFVK